MLEYMWCAAASGGGRAGNANLHKHRQPGAADEILIEDWWKCRFRSLQMPCRPGLPVKAVTLSAGGLGKWIASSFEPVWSVRNTRWGKMSSLPVHWVLAGGSIRVCSSAGISVVGCYAVACVMRMSVHLIWKGFRKNWCFYIFFCGKAVYRTGDSQWPHSSVRLWGSKSPAQQFWSSKKGLCGQQVHQLWCLTRQY